MDEVIRLVKRYGVGLRFASISSKGFYYTVDNLIVVNENLDEETQIEVILHELYHAIKHREFYVLYKIFVFMSKMEHEATEYMLNYLIDEADGFFNYSALFEHFKLNMGWEASICKIYHSLD